MVCGADMTGLRLASVLAMGLWGMCIMPVAAEEAGSSSTGSIPVSRPLESQSKASDAHSAGADSSGGTTFGGGRVQVPVIPEDLAAQRDLFRDQELVA